MTFFQVANYWEAALWVVIAVAFVAAAVWLPSARRRCLVLAFFFAAFGGSDVVEAQYGQWWDPWWLLVWKAACVIYFAYALWHYWQQQRRGVGEQKSGSRDGPLA